MSTVLDQSRLALGTVQFGMHYGVANSGGRVTFIDAQEIIRQAELNGVNTLDTAVAYGSSETTLGQVGIDRWSVITKLPALPPDCQDVQAWVASQIEQSMSRLGVTQLQGVLLHRPDDLLGSNGRNLVNALCGLKAEGRTRQIGVSIYEPEQLDLLSDVMEIDLVQAPLNILDRRLISSGWASRLKDKGVEVHVRSAFLQGLLLMPEAQRPAKFTIGSDVWAEWSRWLQSSGLTPLQACLAYVLCAPDVDKVVVGVDSFAQLNQIFIDSNTELTSLPNWQQPVEPKLINPALWSQL